MNSLSDIKRRLTSIKQTGQITGAMEAISVAKMRKSLELYDNTKNYFDILSSLAKEICVGADSEISELLAPPTDGKDAIVVVSSDKGLCGGFNHEVLNLADRIEKADDIVIPVGAIAEQRYRARGVDSPFGFDMSGKIEYSSVKDFSDKLMAEYGKTFKSISVIYMRLVSRSVFKPRYLKILPFPSGGKSAEKGGAPREFDPSPSAVFERLLPMYLAGSLYGAFVHSTAAEHCARHAAMSASTENADKMRAELTLEYNRARQGAVTEQITEIIGSTQALGSRGVQ